MFPDTIHSRGQHGPAERTPSEIQCEFALVGGCVDWRLCVDLVGGCVDWGLCVWIWCELRGQS